MCKIGAKSELGHRLFRTFCAVQRSVNTGKRKTVQKRTVSFRHVGNIGKANVSVRRLSMPENGRNHYHEE